MMKAVEFGYINSENQTSVNVLICDRKSKVLNNCGTYVIQKLMDKAALEATGSGSIICRQLARDEVLKVSIDCLLAMGTQIVYDFQRLGNSNDAESSCIATMSGPGLVWLQSTSYNN